MRGRGGRVRGFGRGVFVGGEGLRLGGCGGGRQEGGWWGFKGVGDGTGTGEGGCGVGELRRERNEGGG